MKKVNGHSERQRKSYLLERRPGHFFLFSIFLFTISLAATSSPAATYYWDGSSSNRWNNTGNWTVSGGTPMLLPGSSDNVVFYTSGANTSTELRQAFSIQSMTFNSAATNPVTIEGNYALTIGAGGITVEPGSGPHGIYNSRVSLSASQTWTNNSSNPLAVSGRVFLNSYDLAATGTGNINLDGTISGTGGITKSGSETLTLSAVNTYTGGTVVNGGVLLANNSMSLGSGQAIINTGGTIKVASGSTITTDITLNNGGMLEIDGSYVGTLTTNGGMLRGSGAINSPVTVSSGARVSPGSSPGSMTFASGLNLSSGGEYYWELGRLTESGPGVNYDIIYVTGGQLVLGGTSVLSINFTDSATNPDVGDLFWNTSRQWLIIDQTATNSTNFANLLNANYSAGSFSTVLGTGSNSGDVYLTWAPVPEPGTIALLAIGGVIILLKQRKTRLQRVQK